MDFYLTVFFHPHLCSLLLKSAGVAGVSDAVLPYLIPIVAKMHQGIWNLLLQTLHPKKGHAIQPC